ncbi:hypothetical protein D3C71_511240 [compost metagenome]
MKKILFILALSTSAITYAQEYSQKGSWYLGGSAGFSMGNTRQGNSVLHRNSWSGSPEVGTFLTDHIQLGLGITANGSFTETASYSNVRNLQFGGTIYSRYLFGDKAFRPFLGISTSYSAGQSRLYPSQNSNDINTFNANITAGFAYYVTPRIGIFGSIGVLGYTYSRVILTSAPNLVTNDFGFNASTLGNRFTIGMYYTICKGKASK